MHPKEDFTNILHPVFCRSFIIRIRYVTFQLIERKGDSVAILHPLQRPYMNRKNTVRFIIESSFSSLRPSEQKAGQYVLDQEEDILGLSLADAARNAGVSQPTVIRFVKALGFSGYKEFQYELIKDRARKEEKEEQTPDVRAMYGYRVTASDSVQDVPGRIIATTIQSLEDTLKFISGDTLRHAVDALVSARSISIFGVENSLATAKDLCTKLLYLGLPCHSFDDYYLQRIAASNMGKEDVAIGISYSGSSRDTVDVMRTARKSGARTIIMTNFRNSVIEKYADLLLCTSNEQLLYGDAIFSRTTQLALVDMLYLGIIVSDYNRFAGKLDKSSRIISDKAYKS